MLINIMSNVNSILGGLCFTVKFALLHYIVYKFHIVTCGDGVREDEGRDTMLAQPDKVVCMYVSFDVLILEPNHLEGMQYLNQPSVPPTNSYSFHLNLTKT